MNSPADEIHRLRCRLAHAEAMAESLSAALERRSAELRSLMPLLSEPQLRALARIWAGGTVRSLAELRHPFAVEAWDESAVMLPAELPETIDRLWKVVREESIE